MLTTNTGASLHLSRLGSISYNILRVSMRILSLALIIIAITSSATCQPFAELLASDSLQNLDNKVNIGGVSNQRKQADNPTGILGNYDSIWYTNHGVQLLNIWIELKLPGYNLILKENGLRSEMAVVSALLINKDAVHTELTLQIPKPAYIPMVQHNTLASFTRFRPPALDVSGSQKVTLQGIESDYYRISDGSCAVSMPIERYGVIFLKARKCSESRVMFEVANLLNIKRLNQKLLS
jgi:hypothetical protein